MPLSPAAERLLADPGLTEEIEALRVTALRARLMREARDVLVVDEEDFNRARLQRNLVLINRAVQRLARANPEDPALHDSALFVARSYEQLAELEGVDSRRLRMTAAIHYELAGYQANAATMARMAYDIHAPVVGQYGLPTLVSAFLQRRFLRCAVDGSVGVSDADVREVDAALVQSAGLDLARQALGRAASYFISGSTEALSQAQADISIARAAMSDAGLVLDANLLNGVATLLPRLEGVSIWSALEGAHRGNPLWTRYLRALGRGLAGRSPLDLRSISELWPSQRFAVGEGILGAESRVVRMPTSAGKTRIAEMVIADSLARRPGSRALYVAPFNALSTEVEQGFNALFTDLGLSLSSLTGAFDLSSVDEISEQDDLLIVTPEKLDQLLRSDSPFLDELDTVILDEGHVVGEEQRGPKYEMTVSRLRRRRPTARFVALSAVVPDETLDDFSRWLKAERGAISATWRPTIQRLARLRWRDNQGDLIFAPPESAREESLLFADSDDAGALRVPAVVRTEILEYQHPETRRTRRPNFPEPGHRAQVAAAYAWQVVDQGPVLVYCQKPQDASAVCRALDSRREIGELRGDPIPRELSYRRRRSAAVAEEWLGRDHDVTQRLYYGIAVHHSTLPEAVKNAIEDDFRDRELSILAATGTLAQGVNLPVRTLIVHTTRRFDEELQSTVPMKARDFWNIAGRVGRAGAETEGTVVFLEFNVNDRLDFQRYMAARERVEPVESALSMLLRGLVDGRISGQAIAEQLDPEMLALLVEENEVAQTPEGIASLMDGSLVSVQAMRERRNPRAMWQVMAATSTVIAQRVTDLGLRAVYAGTGLSAATCVRVQSHVDSHLETLRRCFEEEDVETLVPLLLEGLSSAKEMAPRYSVDASHADLLERWMSAEDVGTVAAQFGLDSVQLTGFIEDFFGYRLPWGVSGYLRIAQEALEFAELPRRLASVPALIRYGVPSEVAAWAMALGIPSRSVSLQLSQRYLQGHSNPSSVGLRRWLSSLDPDSLGQETGLGPDGIRAATRAVMRAHGNDFLRAHYAGAPLLPLTCRVRLDSSAAARLAWNAATSQRVLRCVRDYDSSYRNAVVLELDGRAVARLPRGAADAVALEIDSGRNVAAREEGVVSGQSGIVDVVLDWAD